MPSIAQNQLGQALLVDELNRAKFAHIVRARIFKLAQHVIVPIDLKDKFAVEVSPLGDIVDGVGVDEVPGIFGRVAEVVRHRVLDLARAPLAVVEVLAELRKLLGDCVPEVVLERDLEGILG